MATIAPFFSMVFSLNLARLRISVAGGTATGPAPLFSGSGSVFEATLRRLGCTAANAPCEPSRCRSWQQCAVPSLISRELSSDPLTVKRHQKPGLPYIFSGPEKAEPDTFGLLLLGTALPHLALLLRTVTAISGGRCRLQALDYQGTALPLALAADGSVENLPVLDAAELMVLNRPAFEGVERVRIDLRTPLRLLHNSRELTRFPPEQFVRSLLRRISALAACYGEGADTEWFRQAAVRAAEVRLVAAGGTVTAPAGERGILGSYLLSGPWQQLGPLLAVGSLLHLGKGASYGRGAFQVVPCP